MHICLTARLFSGYVVQEPRRPCEVLDTRSTQARVGEGFQGFCYLPAFALLSSSHYRGTSSDFPHPLLWRRVESSPRISRVRTCGQCFLRVYHCHSHLFRGWSLLPCHQHTMFCGLMNLKQFWRLLLLGCQGQCRPLNKGSRLLGLRL